MSGTTPVSLVLLAWNRWALTERALVTLLETDLAGAQVLVVDNGSDDATPQALAAWTDRVRVLRLPHNVGYVRGNNAGIAAVDPRSDVVLLNNDLEFIQRDWLTRLAAAAHSAPDVGIAGCRLVGADGRLQHAGSRLLADDLHGAQLDSGRRERDVGQYAGRTRQVQAVVFAAVYLRRAVLDAVGPLSTDYETYYEDSDYCLRARAAGWRSVLAGDVTLLHREHGSTTTNERQRLHAAGRARFAATWGEALRARYEAHVHWQSALAFPPRHAHVSRPLLDALDRAGVYVDFAHLYESVLPPELHEDGDTQHYVLNAIRSRRPRALPDVGVACGEPALWRAARGAWRIGYGAWDGLEPAPDDVAAAQAMDEVWVPSEFHARALRDAGVTRPVAVVPWQADPDRFHPGITRVPDPHGEFVFLLVAAWDEFDRPWQAIRAFKRAFRNTEAVRLVCCIDARGVDLMAATRALRLDPHGGRVSFLRRERIDAEQRAVVLRSADAWFGASIAGGRHLDVLEAMAVGLPVIAPACGAVETLLDAQTGWLLAREADLDAMAAALRQVVADPAQARRRGAVAAARRAADGGWDATAQAIRDRLAAPRGTRSSAQPPLRRGRVIVLGMHRSGTSAVAGLLHMMGLYGGRRDEFLHDAADNARGHYERADLHLACVEALRRRGGDWSIPLGWSDAGTAPAQFRREAAAILAGLERHGAWFAKEPRLCLLWPELALEDAIYVHVVRDPLAVAQSLTRRDGLHAAHGLALWEKYNIDGLAAGTGRSRLIVDYATLRRAPADVAARLHAGLAERGVRGLRALQPAEAAAWIAPELDHHRSAALPLTASQAALWQRLQAGEFATGIAPPQLGADSESLLRRLYDEHQAALAQRPIRDQG